MFEKVPNRRPPKRGFLFPTKNKRKQEEIKLVSCAIWNKMLKYFTNNQMKYFNKIILNLKVTMSECLKEKDISWREKYVSPLRKVITVLEKGRNNWKTKCTKKSSEIIFLRKKVDQLTKSRESWKNKACTYEKELKSLKEEDKKKNKAGKKN